MGAEIVPQLALIMRRVAKSQASAAVYFRELEAALAPLSALANVCTAAEMRLARAHEDTRRQVAVMRQEQSATLEVLRTGSLDDLVRERDRLCAKGKS